MTPVENPSEKSAWSVHERTAVLLLILLTGGLLLARLSGAEPLRSANDRSRWCTVWSLGTKGTYVIDEIIQRPGWDSIDKVRHEEHFYSSKPPLYPTILAGLYVVIHKTTGMTLTGDTKAVTQWMLLLVNILPFLLAMYCWWKLMLRIGFSPQTRILLIALTGLATLLTPFLTSLNNHTPAATCLMLALTAAVYILIPDNRQELSAQKSSAAGWLYAVCGFFSAWTCCHELPAALFGVAIFGLLAYHDWKKTLFWFVPAALLPIAGFVVTTYIATGGWKPFYMYYGTEKYVYEYLGIPSYWSEPKGLDKARDTVSEYVFHCLLGHHGIFSLTPLLLLCIPGYWLGIRHRAGALKNLHLLGLLLTVAILVFYWRRTENYNYGGVSVALRWVLWLVPFWLLALAEWLERPRRQTVLVWSLMILGLPSLYSVWEPWQSAWQQPWLFRQLAAWNWIDYSDPPEPFKKPVHGWLNQLPNSENVDPDYWSEFRDDAGRTMRLQDAGRVEEGGETGRVLVVEYRNEHGNLERTRRLILDPRRLANGETPALYLIGWEDTQSGATLADQLHFLGGIPAEGKFRPGHYRYLFTPLQEHAIRSLLIANRHVQRAVEKQPAREYRCDLWLNQDFPYGLVQMQLSVTNLQQRFVTSRNTWTIVAHGSSKSVTTSTDGTTMPD